MAGQAIRTKTVEDALRFVLRVASRLDKDGDEAASRWGHDDILARSMYIKAEAYRQVVQMLEEELSVQASQ